jgi:hypothetical protein
MATNRLYIKNFDCFYANCFENSFSILAELEKKISKYSNGECEEVESIKIKDEIYVLFEFVEYLPSTRNNPQNMYVYLFTGSFK